jgi:hypothetical protein
VQLALGLPKICQVLPVCSIGAATIGIPLLGLANHYFAVQYCSCEMTGPGVNGLAGSQIDDCNGK